MKIFKLILGLLVLTLAGGFGYFAVTDVPIEKKQISKTIPNERFFDEK